MVQTDDVINISLTSQQNHMFCFLLFWCVSDCISYMDGGTEYGGLGVCVCAHATASAKRVCPYNTVYDDRPCMLRMPNRVCVIAR